MKIMIMSFILSVLWPMVFSFPAFAYGGGFARVSFIQGDVVVQTDETGDDWIPASLNIPLMSGDSVWVPDNGRSEIQISGGSYIRAENSTWLDIIDAGGYSRDEFPHMAVAQGRLYVYHRKLSGNDALFQIDTPLISATAYSPSRFDINVYEDGYTEISVIEGTVYVEGPQGNTKVESGTMISAGGDSFRLSPVRRNDIWLSWNISRDTYTARTGTSSGYLPATLDMFCDDFDRHGRWVHTPDYGYVWSPGITLSTWAPYQHGKWEWLHNDYVWVSNEPWGWVPYHYGRWAFRIGIGWFWVPPAVNDVYWSPGFVAWIYTPTYVSWVPLAPGEMYYGHGDYGRHSMNIHKVKNKHVNKTNVYVNAKITHAVTVVHHDTFVKGKERSVAGAPANPFLAGIKISAGRPSVKPVRQSIEPLRAVPNKNSAKVKMADMTISRTTAGKQGPVQNKGNVSTKTRKVSPQPVNKEQQAVRILPTKEVPLQGKKAPQSSGSVFHHQEPGTASTLSVNAKHHTESGNERKIGKQAANQKSPTFRSSSSPLRPDLKTAASATVAGNHTVSGNIPHAGAQSQGQDNGASSRDGNAPSKTAGKTLSPVANGVYSSEHGLTSSSGKIIRRPETGASSVRGNTILRSEPVPALPSFGNEDRQENRQASSHAGNDIQQARRMIAGK